MDEKRLREIEARANLMQYSGTNPHYTPKESEMRPCTTMQDVYALIAEVKRLRPVVEAAQAISDAFGPIETIPLPGLDTINYGPSANMVRAELIVRLREKLAALAGEKGETPCSS